MVIYGLYMDMKQLEYGIIYIYIYIYIWINYMVYGLSMVIISIN